MSTSSINVRAALPTRPYIQFWVTKDSGTTGYGIRVYRKQDIDLVRQIASAFHQHRPYVLQTPTAESVAVIYLNQFADVKFIAELRKFFDIRNDDPRYAQEAIARAKAREKAIAICKARISRHNLNTIKHTMVNIFGSPAEVKALFDKHGIKIVHHAQLPQCLKLLELERKLQMCLTKLQTQPIKATVVVSKPSAQSPAPVSPVKVDVPTSEAIPPHSVLTCAYEPKIEQPESEPDVADRELELTLLSFSLKELRQYMKEYGITGRGTRGFTKEQLVTHIIDSTQG